MRLEITCSDRLGLCQDVLTILRENEIDLKGIEVDPIGKIFVSFPNIDFADFQLLMAKIRRIPNVQDVKTIAYMPTEREHYEFNLLLSTLPNPVISVDTKGRVDVINSAAANLLDAEKDDLKGAWISELMGGFNVPRWLEKQPQDNRTEYLQLGSANYRANIAPIWVHDAEGALTFAGAVIHCQAEPMPARLGQPDADSPFVQILTQHAAIKRLLKDAERMAQLDVPLLIEGETGVGKELIARACHRAGNRAMQPFLAVNCGALPDMVAESELFGYGADVFSHHPQGKKGIFEQAQGGTVLLDSVGDMSAELQAKLLRFLEDGSFRRIGEEQMVKVDVRVICLARGDLLERVEQGRFREDLYYRLNVLSLQIPPLRERKGDVTLLAEHFTHKFCAQLQRSPVRITTSCREYLQQYSWPGNVRQLENTLFRSLSMLERDVLEASDIHLPEMPALPDQLSIDVEEGSLEDAVKRFESTLLRRLYPSYPSTRQLARKLGLSHTAIANKLRDYGIGKQRQR